MKLARLALVAAAFAALAACASGAPSDDQRVRGQALVETNCASCHATGFTGLSPAPEAPEFRTLSQNYRVADIEEALAEGISVGHPAMPNFTFDPEDARAIVIYLESVQEERAPS